ncbi:S-layer homology domain-containing protein [Paenibacillus chitinolyticus]|uniref:S-layer homology domain-containing protein n=1 Tax=Paenibacillus chitinolyticus TaxID=79263 RepID=A0ABT4FFF7_9BACL|nr:S-layer homology domain-containing protein [Paenibacillus chitinolyticus]MCY9590375.1 S-layer homology domain-containing protein [Paenibacillus chitinolyticus]MCY9596631.1 S-layer homology domain-containing protein [Paenibacillus chitinolyticus]
MSKKFYHVLTVLTVFVVLFSSTAGSLFAAAAPQQAASPAEQIAEQRGSGDVQPDQGVFTATYGVPKDRSTLVQWNFRNAGAGDNGIYRPAGGVYGTASTFRNSGGVFEYVEDDTLSYQGWDEGNGVKHWLAAVPTKGFRSITLSSQQNSSGSGPRNFKVEISQDKRTWTPIADLVMAKSSYNCSGDSCKLNELPLPSEADNQPQLYIRWIVSSDEKTSGGPGIGGSGSSRIRAVEVKGERISGSDISEPTVAVAEFPGDKSEEITADRELSLKFNKKIALENGKQATVADENGNVSETFLQVSGDTLTIKHTPFAYEKTYTVLVPKELVKGAEDGYPLAGDITWSFKTRTSPKTPKLLNMTFNGDPKTSMSFAWYTPPDIPGTVVQVIEASEMKDGVFPEAKASAYSGSSEVIESYFVKSDRDTGNKTKFASHKVTADRLKPGTAYKYRAGNGEPDGWGPVGSFTTDGAADEDFRFIVGSDSQGSSKSSFELWQDTFRKAVDKAGQPKFFMVTGDLVDNGDLEQQWQWLLDTAKNELAHTPYVPILGGHEVHDYEGDENTENNNFYYHFNLPKQIIPGTHEGSIYSFEYGDALFIQFNTQFEGGLDPSGQVDWVDPEFTAQLEWMKNVVARTDKKWKFVSLHKGPYSAGDNAGEWEGERIAFYKKHLIPALDQMGIDVVFEAHDHMYMRSYQMLNDVPMKDIKDDGAGNALNPPGTVYLMTNTVGSKFYEKYKGYDDYFAKINEQPFKKMFTDVSVSKDVMKFTSYTAVKGEDVKPYDEYGIKRTNEKPAKVENAAVQSGSGGTVLSWNGPKNSKEPVKGYRIYEKDDKIRPYWSEYVPDETKSGTYKLELGKLDPKQSYTFVIKAAGVRTNSDAVQIGIPKDNGSSGGGSSGGDGGSSLPPVTTVPPVTGTKPPVNPDGKPKPEPEPEPKPKPEPARKTFTDVDSRYAWAKDAIELLAGKGVIQGVTADTFEPARSVTRGEFVTLLVRALGLKADTAGRFGDVLPGAYYYEAVGTAKALGIAEGTGPDTFDPGALLTRQDMMALIVRALNAAGYGIQSGSTRDLAGFDDASELAPYAVESAAALVRERLVEGSGTGIMPYGLTTRAEAAVILYRVTSFK